jgi:hypothetical protein
MSEELKVELILTNLMNKKTGCFSDFEMKRKRIIQSS